MLGRIVRGSTLAVVGLLAGPAVGYHAEGRAGCEETSFRRPAFVERLVEQYRSGPKDASPGSIWTYRYKGADVVYVPPLFDDAGNVLCSPDGGPAGAGNGRCPDFLAERTGGRQIWKDPRVEPDS